MEKYLIKKEDYLMIKKIFNISLAINTLYHKLYELEINDKFETKEYFTTLNYLYISIDVENQLYEESRLNSKKCSAWIDYLLKDCIPVGIKNDMDSILYQDDSYCIIRRMVNILSDKLVYEFHNDDFIPSSCLDTDYDNEISQLQSYGARRTNLFSKMKKEIEYDFFNYYLSFLTVFSNDSKYFNLKNNIVLSKYNVSFINPRVERTLLKNRFIFNKSPYSVIKYTKEFEYDNNLMTKLKDVLCFTFARDQIIKLLHFKNKDYQDKKNATTVVLYQCLLRANCLMLDNEFIEDLKYLSKSFNDDIHDDNSISEAIISKCLKMGKFDKKKCKTFN